LKYHSNPGDLQTIELSDDNHAAKKLIQETFKKLPSNGDPDFMKTPAFLEGGKFDIFMQKVRMLPTSEQRFLLVRDLQASIETISKAIKNTGVNVFNRPDGLKRIVPSTGMMQAFLEAEYGDDAVQLNPVIYQSTEMHIRECSLNDARDIEFPFPNSKGENRCTATADGYPAPWYDFSYHDFYHAIHASAVGREFRRAGIIASDAIKDLAARSEDEQKSALEAVGEKILDMQYGLFLNYYKGGPYSKTEAFWLQMNQEIQELVMTLQNECDGESHLQQGILTPFKAIYDKVTTSCRSLTRESFESAVLNFRTKLDEVIKKRVHSKQISKSQVGEFLKIMEMATPLLVLDNHLKS